MYMFFRNDGHSIKFQLTHKENLPLSHDMMTYFERQL